MIAIWKSIRVYFSHGQFCNFSKVWVMEQGNKTSPSKQVLSSGIMHQSCYYTITHTYEHFLPNQLGCWINAHHPEEKPPNRSSWTWYWSSTASTAARGTPTKRRTTSSVRTAPSYACLSHLPAVAKAAMLQGGRRVRGSLNGRNLLWRLLPRREFQDGD